MDLRHEIETAGYVRIDNLSLDDPNETLEQAIASFAQPIAYLGLPLVMDLKPQPGFQPASYAGTGQFDMHTDLTWFEEPPTYIGMFCVNMETTHGGLPLLSDGWQALADLEPGDIDYLKREPVTFPPPDHIDYAPLSSPIISERNGKQMIRFRYDLLTDPAPPIQRYFAAINRHIIQLELKPGSMFIFNNDRMLHGRTALKAGLGSDRHFKRIYGQSGQGR